MGYDENHKCQFVFWKSSVAEFDTWQCVCGNTKTIQQERIIHTMTKVPNENN